MDFFYPFLTGFVASFPLGCMIGCLLYFHLKDDKNENFSYDLLTLKEDIVHLHLRIDQEMGK